MATKILQFPWFPGRTLTCNVYPRVLGAPAFNASPLTGTVGANTRLYQFSMTDAASGVGLWVEMFDNGSYFGTFKVDLVETAGYYDLCNGPTQGEIAAGLSTGITVNSYLSITPAQAQVLSQPNSIPCQIGCTFGFNLLIGTITGWSELIFTVKRRIEDADSASLIQIKKFASGGTNGLIVFNGTDTGFSNGDGAITISDETTGSINIALIADRTVELALATCVWGVKVINPASEAVPKEGNFVILPTVTRSRS